MTESKNIHQRINAVQREVREVKKTRENKHFNYKFIGHDDVTAALRDAKVSHGIVTEVTVNTAERTGPHLKLEVLVSFVNMDQPDNRVTVTTYGESFAEPTRSNPEPRPSDLQMGKALSYAVKLAELKVFQLIGDSTPDSEEAHKGEPASSDDKPVVTDDIVAAVVTALGQVHDKAGLNVVNAEINRLHKTHQKMSETHYNQIKEAHIAAGQRAHAPAAQ